MVGRSGTEGQGAPCSVMSLLTGTSTHRCVPPTTQTKASSSAWRLLKEGESYPSGVAVGQDGREDLPVPFLSLTSAHVAGKGALGKGRPRGPEEGRARRAAPRAHASGGPVLSRPGAWSGSGRSRGLTDGLLAKERVQTCVFGDVISESREMLPPRFSAPPPGTLGAAPAPAAAGSSAPGGGGGGGWLPSLRPTAQPGAPHPVRLAE